MLILSLMRLSLTVLWVTVLSIEPCLVAASAYERICAHIRKDAPLGVHVPEYMKPYNRDAMRRHAFNERFRGIVNQDGKDG
jgi:hypothetical protein